MPFKGAIFTYDFSKGRCHRARNRTILHFLIETETYDFRQNRMKNRGPPMTCDMRFHDMTRDAIETESYD